MKYKSADTIRTKDNNSIVAAIVWLIIAVETLFISNIFSLDMFIGKALTGKIALTLMMIIFAALELIFSTLIVINKNNSVFLGNLTKRTILIESIVGSTLLIMMPFIIIK